MMDEISDTTGFSFSLGYVSENEEFGLVSGPRSSPYGVGNLPSGNLTVNDTMALGSGTKTFTGAAIMRLVDQKVITLDDFAVDHANGPMKEMWNTTLEEVFGDLALKLTVGDLIHMKSGL
jgi:CubicO group peptidase (beta-lactamase class C family)